jgi:predicted metal-dependent HD superfamily phosphohydrolase
MNESKSILDKSSIFVSQFFEKKIPQWAVYHNLQHTIETVNGCLEIGKGSNLTADDLEIVRISAWFHDIGYIFTAEGHEEKSAEISMKFLKSNDYPPNKISKVTNCILATKIINQPKNLLEFIICDSDLISLGRTDYFEKNDLLKLEIEMRSGKKINDEQWLRRSAKFLSSHYYFTEYAKLNFNLQLRENLLTLQKQILGVNL